MDEKRLIPVTSLASLKTYRNIYCLQCNEGQHGNNVVWKTFQTCYADFVKHISTEPTKWWLTDFELLCNVVYEPPDHILNYTSKCKQVREKVDTCPGLSSTNKDFGIDKSMLKSVCSHFYLPVYGPEKQDFIIYDNIACYLCHHEQLWDDVCEETYRSETAYQLEINTERTHNYYTTSNSILKRSFSENCTNGFIYDSEIASCRKVLCPRYTIIYDGVCIPFLLQTRNIFYTIFLEVHVNASKLFPNSANFFSNYETYINAAADDTFADKALTVWKKSDGQQVLVLLNVRPKTELYEEIIYKTLDFIKKISRYQDPGRLSTIYPEVNIQDEYLVTREVIKTELSIRNISYPANQWTEKEFRLSNINFCPRIAINASETKQVGRQLLQLRSGKRVTNIDATFPNRLKVYLVCIEDVFPYRSPRYDSVIPYRNNFKLVTIKAKGTEFEPLPVIIVAALLVTVVLLVTIPKVYSARRVPTNGVQTSSPSNSSAQ